MTSSAERCLEGDGKILQSLTAKCPIRLSWTHYSIIQQETTADGRIWYENEAAKEMWSTRTLQRNSIFFGYSCAENFKYITIFGANN